MNVSPDLLRVIDLVVTLKRFYVEGKTERRVFEVKEVGHATEKMVHLGNVFEYNASKDRIDKNGMAVAIRDKMVEMSGIDTKKYHTELEKRKKVIQFMVKNNITEQLKVVEVIRDYYENEC